MTDPSKMYTEDEWPSSEEETMSIFDDSNWPEDCCCSLRRWLFEPALSEGNFGVS